MSSKSRDRFWELARRGRSSRRQNTKKIDRAAQIERLAELEPRLLLSNFSVTNNADTGPGSLRNAITSANATPGSSIGFSLPSGQLTITPATALPAIAASTIIDATSQSGYGSSPLVTLDGASLGSTGIGLQLSAANTTVKGLAIVDFGNIGLQISASGTTNDVIQGDYFGLKTDATTAAPNKYGLTINGSGNTIGGGGTAQMDIISGNTNNGIAIVGGSSNVFIGDLIGLNAAQSAARPNSIGVYINGGNGNVFSGNVISGNTGYGVDIVSGTGETFTHNWIGLVGGNGAIMPNTGDGIFVATSGNVIGDTSGNGGNIIAGNGGYGIDGSGASDNLIQQNFVGTDQNGASAKGNALGGIYLSGGTGNTIGGTVAATRNVISGNTGFGVGLSGTSNLVLGNYIGTTPTGGSVRGNAGVGVSILGSANTIGGTVLGAGNVISGNGGAGVFLDTSSATSNRVAGNFLGTDASGTVALGNGTWGVIDRNAQGNTIGAAESLTQATSLGGGRNVIAGNAQGGIAIYGGNATNVLVRGNYLGVDGTGNAALGNAYSGVFVGVGTGFSPSVGGTATGATITGNLVSGNQQHGVWIDGGDSTTPSATNASVTGNIVGLNAGGTAKLPNTFAGVFAQEATGNTIGGTTAAASNVIAGNSTSGISLGTGSTGNLVLGNSIGTNATGSTILGNAAQGVYVNAANNTIGAASGTTQVIGGNAYNGIFLDSGATSSVVLGNYIGEGTGASGAAIPNSYNGIAVTGASVSLGVAGAGNFIAGNVQTGIYFTGASATAGLVVGNTIGLNASARSCPTSRRASCSTMAPRGSRSAGRRRWPATSSRATGETGLM